MILHHEMTWNQYKVDPRGRVFCAAELSMILSEVRTQKIVFKAF